jgi:penicillin-insensitive murein DD-endopeptidase
MQPALDAACTARHADGVRRLLPFLLLFAAAAGPQTPAPGPVRVIGNHGGGCIAGAVRLADTAPGLQTIRQSHSSFWGHPDTIAALLDLGRRVRAAGLPDMYMGDISAPRGGPLAGGHMSHQMGLDADIYLDMSPRPLLSPEQREAIEPPSMVLPDGRGVDPAHWSTAQETLLRLAAAMPGVDRILVNPAIKKKLCEDVTGDRAWLHLIRPWYDHDSHMHIHFRCPADQPDCPQQAPPPAGDGCDATLQWWFDRLNQPAKPPSAPAVPPAPPEACRAILDAP